MIFETTLIFKFSKNVCLNFWIATAATPPRNDERGITDQPLNIV